jgi:protein JSN1
MGGRYRPPALRALASGGSPPGGDAPPQSASNVIADPRALGQPTNATQYPPGFRRARAGTLPSNIGLAAQRFTAPTNVLGNPQPSAESLLDQLAQNSLGPVRPNLRHSSSIASSVASSAIREPNSRLRSESLTLPPGGLSNAFGPSIFSSSWLPSSNGGNNGYPVLDELRSDGEDFDHHTLDYLGLDDGYHRAPPPAATISELRNQAQAAIAGNLAGNPSRLRASTVSNPYRTRPGIPGNMLSPPAGGEEEEYDSYNEPAYIRQRMNSFGPTLDTGYNSGYDQNGYKSNDHLGIPQSNRPRAISVGTLEDPMRQMQRRNTVAEANTYINEIAHQSSGLQVLQNNMNGNSILAKAEALAAGRNPASYGYGGPEQHAPQSRAAQYLLAPGASNRSVSPKAEQSSQTQTPTRSLWIGNLDGAVSSEQLIHVFAPYGAIESLRLLPEKVSGCFYRVYMTSNQSLGMWIRELCRPGRRHSG